MKSNILTKVGKFALRLISILVGIFLSIIGYTILRPILRAVGWIISVATILLVISWLLS